MAIGASFKYVDPSLVAFSRLRTAEVRRALAIHRRGMIDVEIAAQLSTHLSAHARRLRFIRQSGPLELNRVHVVWHKQLYRTIFVLVLMLPALMRPFTYQFPQLLTPIILGPIIGLVSLFFIGYRFPYRIARAASDLRCPDCNYPLSDLPSPFEGVPGAALIRTGPERCPECGTPWPLIPPNFDGSPT